jgi:hypothetical protein
MRFPLNTRPDRPQGRLLYNRYWLSFLGVKRPGRGTDHPLPPPPLASSLRMTAGTLLLPTLRFTVRLVSSPATLTKCQPGLQSKAKVYKHTHTHTHTQAVQSHSAYFAISDLGLYTNLLPLALVFCFASVKNLLLQIHKIWQACQVTSEIRIVAMFATADIQTTLSGYYVPWSTSVRNCTRLVQTHSMLTVTKQIIKTLAWPPSYIHKILTKKLHIITIRLQHVVSAPQIKHC